MRFAGKYIPAIIGILILLVVITGGREGYWLFVGVVTLLALSVLSSIIVFCRNYAVRREKPQKEFFMKLTVRLMGLFLCTGTLITFLSLPLIAHREGVDFSNLEMVLRSVLYALDLFILDLESSIVDRLDYFPHAKLWIVIQAFLSFTCTLAFVLNLIYSRLKELYRLHRRNPIRVSKSHLYVFFGVNRPSVILARDLRQRDEQAVIVFVLESNTGDDDADIWNSLMSTFVRKGGSAETISDVRPLVAVANKQLSMAADETDSARDADLLSRIGLSRVKRFVASLEDVNGELHVFFLSDDEKGNLRNMMALSNDTTIKRLAASASSPVRMYCKSTTNSTARVFEDMGAGHNVTVEIVDPYKLAVDLLKSDVESHPVATAEHSISNPATVINRFEALIVGFGELGRFSFDFLCEFGVFLSEKSDREHAVPLLPEITVVDDKDSRQVESFLAERPGLKLEAYGGCFKHIDSSEHDIFNGLLTPEKCRTINYVVLTEGDDDFRIEQAVTIFRHIRRYRKDMSRLKILVYCGKLENRKVLQQIVDHYNRGVIREGCAGPVMILFGTDQQVYTYDIIVKNSLRRQGKKFFERYGRIKGEKNDWDQRRQRLTTKDVDADGRNVPSLPDLQRLHRQESQDFANAYHAASKIQLLRKAFGEEYDWCGFISRLFSAQNQSTLSGKYDTLHFPLLTDIENAAMRNLAMLEHLRWNVSHIILGYLPDREIGCDEVSMTHSCLRPWEELDEESEKASTPEWRCDYKSYDFAVVETSLALWKPTIPNR